eukprot:jgi/Bigna1/88522/estExt_fgenesh1_pg.C_330086
MSVAETKAKKPVVVLLYSSYGSGNVLMRKHTTYLRDLFVHMKKLKLIEVDGASDREERNRLWNLSKEKTYPLVFLRREGEEDIFIGGHPTIHGMVEKETFDAKFRGCAPDDGKKSVLVDTKGEEESFEELQESFEELELHVDPLPEFLESLGLNALLQPLERSGIGSVEDLLYETSALEAEEQADAAWENLRAKTHIEPGHIARLRHALEEMIENSEKKQRGERVEESSSSAAVTTTTKNNNSSSSSSSSSSKIDRERLTNVRSAVVRQDEEFFKRAYSGEDAKENFEATLTLLKTEFLEPVGLSKAVKGLMTSDKPLWIIQLLKLILLPSEEKCPNRETQGSHRNLINILIVFAVKEEPEKLMSYLEKLDVFPDDVPKMVKLMRNNDLEEEAKYLESKSR